MSTVVTVTNPRAFRQMVEQWVLCRESDRPSGTASLASSDFLSRISAAGLDPVGSAFLFPFQRNNEQMIEVPGGRVWTYCQTIRNVVERRIREVDRVDGRSKHRSLRHSAGPYITPYYSALIHMDVGETVTIVADVPATEDAIAAVLAP